MVFLKQLFEHVECGDLRAAFFENMLILLIYIYIYFLKVKLIYILNNESMCH
jgi:hypothetical protein